MKSTSIDKSADEADSDASCESRDRAVQRRRSSLRKQKPDSKSFSITTTSRNQNAPRSSRTSESQRSSVTTRTAPTKKIASQKDNDDTGILLFRRGLQEFLIRKAIQFYEKQVKYGKLQRLF